MLNYSYKQIFTFDSTVPVYTAKNSTNKYKSNFFSLLMIIFFLLNVLLFSLQLFLPDIYFSDFPAHIDFAVEGYSYSLMSILILALSFLPNNLFLFSNAILLAAINTSSVIVLRNFADKLLMNNQKSYKLDFLIFMLFFCTMIFFPTEEKSYIFASSPNIWHNSTLLLSRLFAILCIDSFFDSLLKFKQFKLNQIKLNETVFAYLKLSIITVLCMWSKPSFLSAFMPACVILLFFVLIKTKGESFFASLLIGVSFVPSLLILFFQNYLLFGDANNEAVNSVAISFFYVQLYWNPSLVHYFIRLLLVIVFPLFVYIVTIKKHKFLEHTICLTTFISWFIAVLLIETGDRVYHANFVWGFSAALFFAYFIALCKLLSDNTISKKVKNTAYVIFSIHFVCGVIYFLKLVLGYSIL